MCSADYAGVLLAFQVFIADELTARGFCHIQVCAWPSPRWGLGLGSVSEDFRAQMNLQANP